MTASTGPWTLLAGNELLGRLTESSRDMWNVSCTFTPGPAFARFEALFNEKAALATALEDDVDDAAVSRFDELEEQTSPPQLQLVAAGGQSADFGLLYVEGDQAGFRLA